jgi:acyl transferase domain-containing protein
MKRHTVTGRTSAGHEPAAEPAAEPEIAIIGMSGRFPMADDVDTFWHNIAAGRECFTEFTDAELLAAGEDPSIISQPNYIRHRPVLWHQPA